MLQRRRPLTALAITAVAGLWLLGSVEDPPLVRASALPAYEGQEVRVEGAVADVSVRPDGSATVLLRQGGHGIEVFVHSTDGLQEGAWVEAEGRLFRWDGRLVMEASTTVTALPHGPHVAVAAIAQDPAAWTDRPLTLRGESDGSRFHGDGYTLPVQGFHGEGPTEARGILQYEAACLCYRFYVHEARPWTPQ